MYKPKTSKIKMCKSMHARYIKFKSVGSSLVNLINFSKLQYIQARALKCMGIAAGTPKPRNLKGIRFTS